MSTLILLCVEFFLTGLFAVGGGLATLPFLTQMSIRHPDWFTQEMLVNMVAVSESTPGPIGVNMATYVGSTVAGIPGALFATLSLVLPSLIIIMLIARVLQSYRENPLVNGAFEMLRPVVAGLIASSAYTILRLVVLPEGENVFSWCNLAILVAFFALEQLKPLKKLHPILFIGAGALLGVLFKL